MRAIKDVGQKVDRTRWGMTPPTVNAYYNSTFNEIVFPAGILQTPFFNDKADDAINYGAIGAVIGHEITHGFDDQGSKFDAAGNFNSLWTPQDRRKFEERAACVSDQFSGYEVQPGLNMQGKLNLGENIADLGGLTMAYNAFLKSMGGKPAPLKIRKIDGFTPEQRFFLGYAQIRAAKRNACKCKPIRTLYRAGASTICSRICRFSLKPSAAKRATEWCASSSAAFGKTFTI